MASRNRYCVKPAAHASKNPLYWDYDRNAKCPCMSGRKFKRCCRPHMPRYIPTAVLAEYLKEIDATKTSAVNKIKLMTDRIRGSIETKTDIETKSAESVQ